MQCVSFSVDIVLKSLYQDIHSVLSHAQSTVDTDVYSML